MLAGVLANYLLVRLVKKPDRDTIIQNMTDCGCFSRVGRLSLIWYQYTVIFKHYNAPVMINAVFCSGSEEERRVYVKANHHNKLAQAGEEPGLHIKIKVTPDMHIGSDFDVYAELKNNTMVTKSCRVMFYAQAVFYNGKLGETCGLGEFTEMNLASTEGMPGSLSFKLTVYFGHAFKRLKI